MKIKREYFPLQKIYILFDYILWNFRSKILITKTSRSIRKLLQALEQPYYIVSVRNYRGVLKSGVDLLTLPLESQIDCAFRHKTFNSPRKQPCLLTISYFSLLDRGIRAVRWKRESFPLLFDAINPLDIDDEQTQSKTPCCGVCTR